MPARASKPRSRRRRAERASRRDGSYGASRGDATARAAGAGERGQRGCSRARALGASKGGVARAKALSKKKRAEIARRAAAARWGGKAEKEGLRDVEGRPHARRNRRRAHVLVGGVLAQTVTFPSREVSPGRDEQQMLMDTVAMLGLVAAAADFLLSLMLRLRLRPK